MTGSQSFQEDCFAILDEQSRRGAIDRRGMLKILAALGATATVPVGIRAASAQPKQIVFVNWGGIANEAFGRFYGKPFEDKNPGVKVVMDSSGPSAGKIRTMVESK